MTTTIASCRIIRRPGIGYHVDLSSQTGDMELCQWVLEKGISSMGSFEGTRRVYEATAAFSRGWRFFWRPLRFRFTVVEERLHGVSEYNVAVYAA